jgi:GDPmannose 4,6-dehydratase
MAVKRALITGITGQDGSYLAELLLGLDYEVHGLYRSAEATEQSPAIRRHHGAIQEYDVVAQCIAEVSPHECYHLAAETFIGAGAANEAATLHTNVGGTWNVLAAVREHAPECRVFFPGSAEMFGAAETAPQDENTPLRPRNVYGVSKVAGYHLMRVYREQHGLFACCGILYNHESPRRSPQFVTKKIVDAAVRIKAGVETRLLLGNLDAVRDWGHARDYVRAMWSMLQAEAPDDYVVATGVGHTVREFVEAAFDAVNSNWRAYVHCVPEFWRPNEAVPLVGNASKARNLLGWRPEVGFTDLVREMVAATSTDLGERASL